MTNWHDKATIQKAFEEAEQAYRMGFRLNHANGLSNPGPFDAALSKAFVLARELLDMAIQNAIIVEAVHERVMETAEYRAADLVQHALEAGSINAGIVEVSIREGAR